MSSVEVYWNKILAGVLTKHDGKLYTFTYNEEYLADSSLPSISLTLPKSQRKHTADYLFPFFFNMLSEGVNRKLQCRTFQIDENDDFSLLAATAQYDTIGAVTVKPIDA